MLQFPHILLLSGKLLFFFESVCVCNVLVHWLRSLSLLSLAKLPGSQGLFPLPPRQLLAVNLLGPLWIQFICSSLHVQGRMPPKCGCDRARNKGYCGGQGEGAEGKTGNELCPAVLLNWQVYSPFSTYPTNHWCDFFSVVSAGFTWTLEYSMHLKINGVRLLSV